MNILILNWRDVRHPKSGGAELVTMEHAKGWVKAGHTVTWLTASYSCAKKESIVEGVRFVRRWGSLSVYLYAPFYLLANARFFDVIVDEVHGFPFFSPLFTKKPVVVFIHEIAGEIWDFMFPFPKNIIGKFLEQWYFRLYRYCLFWTDAPSTVEELVKRDIPRKQCTAIPCPIIKPITKLRITDSGLYMKQSEIRHSKLSNKEKLPTYIFVSRVVKMKGIEEVIKAFSFILQVQPRAQFWIVGSGDVEYVAKLKKMMQEYNVLENVVFWGKVNEMRKYDLMRKAHILLHASVKEGWGLVVLEAASVGTPAVVYNVSGLKDVVKNGITGIVIADNSPQGMARAAVQLIGDTKRYRLYKKNGFTWAHSLQWESAINQSLHILKKAIGQ